MNVVAWDPGASGAFAYRIGGRIKTADLPDDDMRLVSMLLTILSEPQTLLVFESQTGCAGIRTSAPSMFKYGTGYGTVRGAIRMLSQVRAQNRLAPVELYPVTPVKWQSVFGLEKVKKMKKLKRHQFSGTDEQYRTHWKEIDSNNSQVRRGWKIQLRDHAVKYFKNDQLLQPVTLDNCDAMLLLAYGETHVRPIFAIDR